jgi:hypothetical protein
MSLAFVIRIYLWVLSVDRASCHPFGAYNFEGARRFFLKNLCHPFLSVCNIWAMNSVSDVNLRTTVTAD